MHQLGALALRQANATDAQGFASPIGRVHLRAQWELSSFRAWRLPSLMASFRLLGQAVLDAMRSREATRPPTERATLATTSAM